MGNTVLHIKNMVCDRCIMAVREILNTAGIDTVSIKLGEVVAKGEIQPSKTDEIRAALEAVGFELLDDKKSQLVEQIRNLLVELVTKDGELPRGNLSDLIASRMNHDYSMLSKLFSEVNGTTIEKYFISLKIERAKELLTYGEMSLSEIAYALGYSSVAHLSAQFKGTTGMTPSAFRSMRGDTRRPLDMV